MRHDSRPQILPRLRQDSEHQSIHADDHRRFRPLINVPAAKQHRREKHAERRAASPRDKLPLQVAAKNRFLANAGRDGERDPKDRFEQALWSKSARSFGHSRRMNKPRNDSENENCRDPEAESNGNIDEEIGGGAPTFASDVS